LFKPVYHRFGKKASVYIPWGVSKNADKKMEERKRNCSLQVCPDHIHMLPEILSKYSVSGITGYLKGKSSLMIFEKYANLKYKSRGFLMCGL